MSRKLFLRISVVALATLLSHVPPTFAADARVLATGRDTAVRRALAPTLVCREPFVADAGKTACVCPEGRTVRGGTCVVVTRRAPLTATRPTPAARRNPALRRNPASSGAAVPSLARAPAVALQPSATRVRPGFVLKSGEFNTKLEVQTIKSDVINAWSIQHSISAPQRLFFRWSTQAASPVSAQWRITGVSSTAGTVQVHSATVPVPVAGQLGYFNHAFPGDYESFKVEVVVSDAVEGEIHSIPVHIDYGPPDGPTPTISLPKTVFTIDQIYLVDDSDLHGTGEIDFCVWAEYAVFAPGGASVVSGLSTPVTTYRNEDFDSGTWDSPGIELVIDDTPKYVTLHVKGRDDDTAGGFTHTECSGSPSEYDFATGSRHVTLPTGATATDPQAFPMFLATGDEDLEFEVHGHWQVVP